MKKNSTNTNSTNTNSTKSTNTNSTDRTLTKYMYCWNNIFTNIEHTKTFNSLVNYHRETLNIYNSVDFYKDVNYIPIPKKAYEARDNLIQDIKDWVKSPHNRQIFILGCGDGPGEIIINYLRRLSTALPKLLRFDENARAITKIPISVYDWRQSAFTSRFDQSQIKAARPHKAPRLRIYILDNYIPALTTPLGVQTKFYDIRLKLDHKGIERIFLDAIEQIKATHAAAMWRYNSDVIRYSMAALIAQIREYRVFGLRILYSAPKRLLYRLLGAHYQPIKRTIGRRQARIRIIPLQISGTAITLPTTLYYSRIVGATLVESDQISATIGQVIKRDKFRDVDEPDDFDVADLWVEQTECVPIEPPKRPQTIQWELPLYPEPPYEPYPDPYTVFNK
ncbi:hypothetical protein F-S17_0184 [Faustovirus]|nr:hypothetical protein F-S17_0184 [Faustovirus]